VAVCPLRAVFIGPGQPVPAAVQSELAVLDDHELHALGVAAAA
jgi:hypothetical protein